MNSFILDSRPKPVNLLLGALDEKFEWDASKNLHTGLGPPANAFHYFASCTNARFAGWIGIALNDFPGKELLLVIHALLPGGKAYVERNHGGANGSGNRDDVLHA